MFEDIFVAPMEFKFSGGGEDGTFDGYGAVFGNQDSHGDVILPGAFASSLAQIKADGTMPGMYVEHGPALGGDRLPAGVWTYMEEDARGLRVKGKLSALDTDYGRRLRSLMQDGAMKGLSIGYRLAPGGAIYGKKAGEPRRQIKALNLIEVSIVRDPSNASARIDSVKSAAVDSGKAAGSIAAAMRLHDKSMAEGYSYASPKDKALLMDHLRDAHEALTGVRAPDGLEGWTKSDPTIRTIEGMLREEFKLSNAQARALAERWFKSTPREEAGEEATKAEQAALTEIGTALTGFSLPSFK